MKNEHAHFDVQARKQALKARLSVLETSIRKDISDLRDDLRPLKQIGSFVKNMLMPEPSGSASAGALGFVAETGLNIALNQFLPGKNLHGLRTVAPVLLKNLASHALPKAKSGLEKMLAWVAEKTEAPKTEKNQSEKTRKTPTQTGPVYAKDQPVSCPCGLMSKDLAKITEEEPCLCGAVHFGTNGISWTAEDEHEKMPTSSNPPRKTEKKLRALPKH